jgi:GT2 family glycosyltransferase
MKINIIVPTYNDKEIYSFIDCFNESSLDCKEHALELSLIIANDHQKPVISLLGQANQDTIEVQTSINQWWTESIIVGLKGSKKIKSDLTIIATSDILFDAKAIKELSDFMQKNQDVSICHPMVLCTIKKTEVISAKKLLISKNLYFPKSILASDGDSEVDMLSGRFAVIRTNIFEQMTFDKGLIHYAADYDFFMNASRKGHNLILTNKAVVHVDSTRTGQGKNNILTYDEYFKSFKNIKSRNYFKSLKYFYIKNFGFIYGSAILCAKISSDFIYLTSKKLGFIK